ncbi:MAG: hypothetical protein ACI9VI_001063 [Candidatus Azotimanducaceae bacterium]|jgi:hypothetical protein
MKYSLTEKCSIVILFLVVSGSVIAGSTQSSFEKDARTLDGIIGAYYRLVSGPEGFKYNAKIDRFLHAPNAIITRFTETGEFQRHALLAEQKSLEKPYAEGLYEIETHRTAQRYANLAHVWSTYEMRATPDGKAFKKGINSISLYFKDGRWWIASWSTQAEGANKIPEQYLPKTR